MVSKKRYTHEENKAIFRAFEERASTIEACSLELSKLLGRDPKAISVHYYGYVKKHPELYKENSSSGNLYTDEDDIYIWNTIKERTTTKANCFILIARELGRSPESVVQRWYNVVGNENHPKYRGPANVTITKKGISVNKINNFKYPEDKIQKTSFWKKLIDTLTQFIKN